MDPQQLTGDCLIHIFTFLAEDDLIRASGVCKVRIRTCGSNWDHLADVISDLELCFFQDWHEAAETPWLWR